MSGRRGERQTVLDLFNNRGEDRIDRRQTEKQLLDILDKKNAEIGILHQVNSRLGAELAILQKKLGIDHDLILQELQSINQVSVAFHYELEQLQYLDSLLSAYDDNSLKQKKLIAHLYSQLEDSEKKAQSLTKDNEFLIGEMQGKCKQILQIYSKGFPEHNLISAYGKLQRQTETQIIQNIRQQNQYLLKHYNEVVEKCKKLQKQLSESKKGSQQYYTSYKQQSEELTSALIKVDDLGKIKQILQKKFDEITQQNLQLETVRQQLQSKVNKLQQDYKLIKGQFQQQKRSTREEIQKVNESMETIKSENEISQKREREYFNKNMTMERQIQTLKEENRGSRRELQKVKSDFEQTLRMCEAYETKIGNYTRKEEFMKNMVEESKQKLDSALLERDKLYLKEQELQKFIENMRNKNRDQMQSLKATFEKIINSQNEKMKILEETKEDYESNYHQNECSLKHQIDKLRKENSMLRQENNKHINSIRNTSGNEIVNKLKQLQDKNESLSRMLSQKQRIMRDDVEHKQQMIRNLQSQNRDLSRQVDKERLNARQALNERTQHKSKISILQKEKECLEQENIRLKRTADSRSNTFSEENQWKVRQLEEKLNEAVMKEKQTRMKAIEMLQKYDRADEELKLEYQNRINELESENGKLRRKVSRN